MMKVSALKSYLVIAVACLTLSACAQSTPSMMNASKIELTPYTAMEQIPAKYVNDAMLNVIAEDYRRYGAGPMELTMTYDPKSRSYTAMKAVRQLNALKAKMNKKGLPNVVVETIPMSGEEPSLLISYPSLKAQAPSDCDVMPALDDNQTTRFIGDYKFGCTIETMLAKQVSRPADLEGNGGIGMADGRRTTNVYERYRTGAPNEALEGLERENLASE